MVYYLVMNRTIIENYINQNSIKIIKFLDLQTKKLNIQVLYNTERLLRLQAMKK